MTLKASRIRTFLWTSASFACLIFLSILGSESGWQTAYPVELGSFSIAIGLFCGLFAAVFFIPGKITWDENRIQIRAFTGDWDFPWNHLQAYSPLAFWGLNLFLIKFRGRQSYQIWTIGYKRAEWKQFQTFLNERHPEKKIWIWLAGYPVRFRRRQKP